MRRNPFLTIAAVVLAVGATAPGTVLAAAQPAMSFVAQYGGYSRVDNPDGSFVETNLFAVIITRGPGRIANEVYGTMTTVTTSATGEQVGYQYVDVVGNPAVKFDPLLRSAEVAASLPYTLNVFDFATQTWATSTGSTFVALTFAGVGPLLRDQNTVIWPGEPRQIVVAQSITREGSLTGGSFFGVDLPLGSFEFVVLAGGHSVLVTTP